MDWYTEAKEKRAKDPSYGYGKIAKEYGLTYDTVRNKFRRDPEAKKEVAEEINKEPLDERVGNLLQNGKTLDKEFICNKFDVSPKALEKALDSLKDKGIQIYETQDSVEIAKVVLPESFYHKSNWTGDKIVRFGVVSDTHLGSFWQQITHLHTMYDIFEREGIADVFHVGDMLEGVNMRPGHQYECFTYGIDNQTNYAVKNYPKRNSIHTKFIIGNHDVTGIKSAGCNVGELIDRQRMDMSYLGILNAKVELTPNCILELNHPLDGASYALSYSLQKTIDAMSGGEKPNILLNGHHHKYLTMFYRNIHALEVGTFESQSSWMKGKRIAAHMGGIIITAHVDENGYIQRFCPEFFPFYKAIPNDY